MAYEVTATRRRPQKFEDLIGQEFVAATLKNSIQSGKIAHAYLFSGPRGCGKTSTARIFAKALNCEKGPTPSPCGECSACKEITKGSSLDVIEIDGASNTSVNDVRQIKDEVQFPPNSSRYKIYIIDEVHMLSNSAFNALLKTIEEPPEYIIFIFATTELQKVPATIKSRCQQFNFRLVPIEKIKEQLALAAAEINIQADDEALYWIAKESTGSMRDAYTLFDQVAAFSESHITYEKIRDKLGLVGTDRLNALFEECAGANPSGAEDKLNEFLQAGISIEQLITNSADYLRSLLLIKNGIAKESLLGQDSARFSKAVLDSWTNVQIERALSIFLNLYRDIRYSLSPRYEIDLAFSRLCWLKEYVSPAEVKVAVDQARSLLATSPGGTPQDFSDGAEIGLGGAPKEFHPEPMTEMPTDPDLIKDALISSFSLEDEALASLLKNTDEWTFDGQKICANISDAFQKSRIEGRVQTLRTRMSQMWGKDLLFEVQEQAPVVEEKKEVKIPDEVNLLVKVFKGEIVGGKV
ncbi:MAG: DNA polymerase III subunit gamma/tau [Treponema sp.]|nr:DNA polymerase III subunit gamma/tau [Treponema sp.]